jgi:hypothetical protein
MGTGFSLDPNEYRAAAGAIEGYGEAQADNGSTLAAGTSTPLSSSGTGIAGAISSIAQGTVQKIVTDVTSTAKGFADDTAKGLRTQADNADQLETELAGNSKAILSGTGQTLSSLTGGLGYGGGSSAFGGTSLGTSAGATTFGSAMSTGVIGAGPTSQAGVIGAGAMGEEPVQETTGAQLGQMRGTGARAGAAEERAQRPGYLKSKTGSDSGDNGLMTAAADKHRQECGVAPIPFGENRLVCAKCGSIIEVEDARDPAAADVATTTADATGTAAAT